MMRQERLAPILAAIATASLASALAFASSESAPATLWGFYAHREINRLAIATVPSPLARFYKTHAGFVSAHAVDPDKRRYAAKLEGPRHFVDVERFGDGTVASLPLTFAEFHDRYTTLLCVGTADSVTVEHRGDTLVLGEAPWVLPEGEYSRWYAREIQRAHWLSWTLCIPPYR